MTKKRIKQKWYSIQKFKFNSKECFRYYSELENGYLYANAIYPTKITKEDLPDDFIYGRFYKLWGYLSTSGIKDLYYRKCNAVPESFKDDALFISFDKPLNKKAIDDYDYVNQNEDFTVWGHEIFYVIEKVLVADEYKNSNVYEMAINIKNQLDEKQKEIDKIRGD